MHEINFLTILGGNDKDDNCDLVENVRIRKGEIIGVVGPTGSGKSTLISDIEQLAQGDTQSKRHILIDDAVPENSLRSDPRKKLVAQLSQNMHFLADMKVDEFLKMHAKSRGKPETISDEVIEIANTLWDLKII